MGLMTSGHYLKRARAAVAASKISSFTIMKEYILNAHHDSRNHKTADLGRQAPKGCKFRVSGGGWGRYQIRTFSIAAEKLTSCTRKIRADSRQATSWMNGRG